MLRAVVSSIPLCHMALYRAPISVIADLERLIRSFLWGRVSGGQKIPWVAWEQVCKGSQIGVWAFCV